MKTRRQFLKSGVALAAMGALGRARLDGAQAESESLTFALATLSPDGSVQIRGHGKQPSR